MSVAAVRIAICDDSRAYAEGLRLFLETDPGLKVVTVATSVQELLGSFVRSRPDLITMDLELPGGVDTIRRISDAAPIPVVGFSADDRDVLAALAAGAVCAVHKDEVRLDRRLSPQAVALRRRLVKLGGSAQPASKFKPTPSSPPPAGVRHTPAPRPPEVALATILGVAASAGGPAALREVLGALPADFGLPVLVVQHISQGYAAGLAAWLDKLIPLPVRLARDGEPARRGVVVAPDAAHLVLKADWRIGLDRRLGDNVHRPSADVLLSSLAAVCGRGAVAVVLTGMGRDGALGVAEVCAAGGTALTERSEDAQVAGMPTAAAAAGATPLARAEIGRTLAALSRRAAS